MKIAAILTAAVAVLGCLALFVAGRLDFELPDAGEAEEHHVDVGELPSAESPSWKGFQYGRVTATDGQVFEGRLRWGRTEEAFWNQHFNGDKNDNPWQDMVPESILTEKSPRRIFGVDVGTRTRRIDLTRPFVARFGDIETIHVHGRDLRVLLKSGTEVALDRYDADDVADGLRIWDAERGTVDLGERVIRRVDFLPNPQPGPGPARLHGTVSTDAGDFTGFIEWNRRSILGSDMLEGRSSGGRLHLHFETIRSIEKRISDTLEQEAGVVVTLIDGSEQALDGHPDVDSHSRGIVVDDPRFGRVLLRWTSFRRVDFTPAGSGPGYDAFAPGRELRGSVTLRSLGGRLEGRVVFDLDESETTDTLDVRAQEVNYSILFDRVASIVLPDPGETDAQVQVMLRGGADLRVDRSGDLADDNGPMLVFDEQSRPTAVPWSDVARIDFSPPRADRGDATEVERE